MSDRSKSGPLKAALLAAAAFLSVMPPASAARISNPVASFSGLDKITGRITSFDVYVGETVQFGALQVTPKACFNRDATQAQRVDAFVEVDEITLDRKIKRIFTGWMFAESPALNAIEHPIFDVWLKECKQKTDVPPPKDLKIPPSGPDPLAPPSAKTAEPPAAQAPAAPADAPVTPDPANPQPSDVPVQQAPLGAPAPDAAPQPSAPAAPQIQEPGVDPDVERIPDDQFLEEPLPQEEIPGDSEALPPLPPPEDVAPVDPDPGFGLPPEPVPDDSFGLDGDTPPPPGNGQQVPSAPGLF